MEPTPTSTPADAVDSHSNSCKSKLRLMCSYGGQIAPRPNSNSLCYAGGETRIVAVDRRTTAANLSSLKSYLSRAVYSNRPFQLKYQLPNEELDALISVTTDEDLENMVEEHDRIVGSSSPSRIRLFLFPAKAESIGSVLLDPKAESWFCDALKGTKIMQRGQSADSGLVDGLMGLDCGDTPAESRNRSGGSGGGDAKNGYDLSTVPESMLLDTNSSFGSSGSSNSMSNVPPIGVVVEDGGVNLMEKKVKPPLTGPIGSEVTTVSLHQASYYQDPIVQIPTVGPRVALESDPRMLKTTQVPPHPAYPYPELAKNQQEVRHIQAGPQFVHQYRAAGVPISPSYPMTYAPPIPQHQQHNQYPPGPVYVVPVRQPQPYNVYEPTIAAAAALRPPVHPHIALPAPQAAHKEGFEATKCYQTGAVSSAHQPVLSSADYEEELSYTAIYKTQPPAPIVTRQ